VVQGGKVDLWIALVCGRTGICFAFIPLTQIGEGKINFFS
jgi:hypothetical protein